MPNNTPAPADLVEAVTDALAKAMYGPDFDPFERPEVHDWASKLAEAAVTTMQAYLPREPIAYLQTFKATGEQKLSLRAQDDLPFNRKNWDQVALYATLQPDPRDAEIERLREALEPFSLISAEGVIKADTGYVTVTTCAEYFHRARTALANSEGKP